MAFRACTVANRSLSYLQYNALFSFVDTLADARDILGNPGPHLPTLYFAEPGSYTAYQSSSMATLLERLFGSRTRVKLVTLFTNGVKRPYYVRELTRLTKERVNSIRREVENLRQIGLLTTHVRKGKKYYVVNPKFSLLDELARLTVKTGKPLEDRLFEGIRRVGSVKLALLSGFFTQSAKAPTDLLIVGDVREALLTAMIHEIEEELGTEIKYTVMTLTEYEYRRSMHDNFLRELSASKPVELVNTLSPASARTRAAVG